MRENHVKQAWLEGKATINGWLHIPSGWSAEVMAHQNYNSLTIDLQHGLLGYETAVTMLQAISTTEVMPFVRVPWNEPGITMKLLDAGAMGVICPMVNTQEECERFVGACRYFPDGYRSLGPTRANVYAGADYAIQANDHIITMAMIETAEAVENAEAIVSVNGLDAIYIGPGDLSLTLGATKRVDNDEPAYLAELDKVLAACQKYNKVAGIHCNDPAYARQMITRGFQFVTVMTDTMLLAMMAANSITAVREGEMIAGEYSKSAY